MRDGSDTALRAALTARAAVPEVAVKASMWHMYHDPATTLSNHQMASGMIMCTSYYLVIIYIAYKSCFYSSIYYIYKNYVYFRIRYYFDKISLYFPCGPCG